ncbi:aminopeptidase [Caproiciproducens sp. CPB-2]|uniref:aminopeptidase n=1 Tax=Caproiciproducens sp. CPB-2 TaxID=3030017 RepID=UPI0023D98EC5|nr:aminopeptidase [Caproiciproducens sp. CPB-2]MDF1495545.1 aminopeptidase [Caproiciproducens sp. CPB-2]
MVKEEILRKYARLAVCMGVHVQPGQMLVLTSSVECAYFTRLCVEEAYRAGAGEVLVLWNDEAVTKLALQQESTETLARIAPWKIEQKRNCIDQKCCFLYVESATPGLLAGIDGKKLQTVRMAKETAFEPFEYYTMANYGQWSIVAIPTVPWAKKVFPDLSGEKALAALWDAVLTSVRITEDNDPVAEWERHNEELSHHCELMNGFRFKSLHFKNGLGTDLTVGLVKDHIWAGGCDRAKNGAVFNPNMPTEEVFTMPDKYRVDGRVYATKPLSYQGKLIENFHLDFQDGKVIGFQAEKEEDTLKNLIGFDEGSCYLGEVALIPYDSPISRLGILFLNTLFDENASCHLALGASYPDNLKNGAELKREELEKLGSNYSKIHCDFMFGSADMEITGTTWAGKQIAVFRNGNFII